MRLRRISSILAVICLSMMLATGAKAQFRAGAGRVSIIPDSAVGAVPLGGYAARKGAPATGEHDTVYARALVLVQGDVKVGIVSLDLCYLPASIKRETLNQLKIHGLSGWQEDHLLLCATHTHSGPDPMAMHDKNRFNFPGWTPYNPKLLTFTAEKIVEAITLAEKDLRKASMTTFSLNTSRIAVGGKTYPALNRNRRGEKPLDQEFLGVQFRCRRGLTIGSLINFAAHPTLFDDKMMRFSADWPGPMTASLDKVPGGTTLFLNGAEGDASPAGSDTGSQESRVQEYGTRMAELALPHMKLGPKDAEPMLGLPLSAWTVPITLPARKPNALYTFAASQVGIDAAHAKEIVNTLMPEKTELSFVKVGDLLLIGFPCEPVAEVGLKAKALARAAGYSQVGVVALANDWLAYCVTHDQYHKGGYESTMSFFGDGLADVMLEGVTTGLKHNN